MALIDMIQQKGFLGPEFVTYLWYRSELDDPTLELEGAETCEVVFEKDLVLTGEAGQATASTLKGESPSLAPEAAAALLAGKKVKRARLSLMAGHSTWEVTLNAQTFDWSGLKIDTPPSLPFTEATPARLNALEEFHRVFSLLYSRFLDLRLDAKRWREEIEAIRGWISSRSREETETQ